MSNEWPCPIMVSLLRQVRDEPGALQSDAREKMDPHADGCEQCAAWRKALGEWLNEKFPEEQHED